MARIGDYSMDAVKADCHFKKVRAAMSTLTLNKPDIINIVQQYTTLRKTGKNYTGLCSLHSEKTPSFTVDPERQRWHCFGCGEGGDVIAFIEKYHAVDFKTALSILGISNDQPYLPDSVRTRKRELERDFRAWCWQHGNILAAQYRLINNALDVLTDTDDMADLYKRRTIVEYHLNILDGNDDAEKFALFREVNRG